MAAAPLACRYAQVAAGVGGDRITPKRPLRRKIAGDGYGHRPRNRARSGQVPGACRAEGR